MSKALSISVLAGYVLASLAVQSAGAAQEVKVKSVTLKVNSRGAWVSSAGTLYRIVDGKDRRHAALISRDGKPNIDVKCAKGELFEADAESHLDRPVTRRIECDAFLAFEFTRSVYAVWSQDRLSPTTHAAAAPWIYSDYSLRASQAGTPDASDAFSDAAIASTAKLLGDSKLDQLVMRDPQQEFKLVFTPAGVDALKSKQKAAGLKASGQLDYATQALFAKKLWPDLQAPNQPPAVASEMACDVAAGQMFCAPPALRGKYSGAAASLRLPPIDFNVK